MRSQHAVTQNVSLLGVLTCPERFQAVQVVKAGGAESTSCEARPGGQGFVWEQQLVIWPGMWWRVQEAEYFLSEVPVVVEPGWLNQMAQKERVEKVQVRWWKKREEVQ